MEKIFFTPDNGEEAVSFFVLERTVLGGSVYLLVTDQEEGDAEALILKEITNADDTESTYEIVEDDDELSAVAPVFENLLEDIEIETPDDADE